MPRVDPVAVFLNRPLDGHAVALRNIQPPSLGLFDLPGYAVRGFFGGVPGIRVGLSPRLAFVLVALSGEAIRDVALLAPLVDLLVGDRIPSEEGAVGNGSFDRLEK